MNIRSVTRRGMMAGGTAALGLLGSGLIVPARAKGVAPTPSMMTGPGTNTYVIGDAELAVIDPGPAIHAHVENIVRQTRDRIRWILVTHTHPDHSPAARMLAAETGAELLGMPPPDGLYQDQTFALLIKRRKIALHVSNPVTQVVDTRKRVIQVLGQCVDILVLELENVVALALKILAQPRAVDREVLERSRVAKPIEIVDPDDLEPVTLTIGQRTYTITDHARLLDYLRRRALLHPFEVLAAALVSSHIFQSCDLSSSDSLVKGRR